MKGRPRDWQLQLAWFVAGVFATGALWYFISTKSNVLASASGILAILFALFAVWLHKARDQADDGAAEAAAQKNRLHEEIRLTVGEELITFTELDRTTEFDIVKVNTDRHLLGVASEHEWIAHRYPGAKKVRQTVTTLDRIQKVDSNLPEAQKVFFDVWDIEFADGRQKKVYFDISRFFNLGTYGTPLHATDKAAERLKDLYA